MATTHKFAVGELATINFVNQTDKIEGIVVGPLFKAPNGEGEGYPVVAHFRCDDNPACEEVHLKPLLMRSELLSPRDVKDLEIPTFVFDAKEFVRHIMRHRQSAHIELAKMTSGVYWPDLVDVSFLAR